MSCRSHSAGHEVSGHSSSQALPQVAALPRQGKADASARCMRTRGRLPCRPACPLTFQMGGPAAGSSTSSAGPTPGRGDSGASATLLPPPRGDCAPPPDVMLGVAGAAAPLPAPLGCPPLGPAVSAVSAAPCGRGEAAPLAVAAAAPAAGDSGCGFSSMSCSARACRGPRRAGSRGMPQGLYLPGHVRKRTRPAQPGPAHQRLPAQTRAAWGPQACSL